jgi:hypothetical protein
VLPPVELFRLLVGYRVSVGLAGAVLALVIVLLSGATEQAVFLFVFCEAIMAMAASWVDRADGVLATAAHLVISCVWTFGLLISAPMLTGLLGLC